MKITDGALDCTVITERPKIIQQDCLEVAPQARSFITAGTPCKCTPMLLEQLKTHIQSGRKGSLICIVIMLVVAGIMLLCFLSEYAAAAAAQIFRLDSEGLYIHLSGQAVSTVLPVLAVGLVLLSILLLRRRRAFLRVIEEAERGNVLWFRYDVRDILRYEYRDTDNDTVYEYYADLGGFAVKLTQKTMYSPTAVGVLAEVGGKEYFFLLI